jgi:hypothetical protein
MVAGAGTLVSMAAMQWRCIWKTITTVEKDPSHGCSVEQERALLVCAWAAWRQDYHKYAHANVSAASPLLNCHIDAHPYHPQTTMGNAQSQNPSPHRIQKLQGKIAAKLPAGRAKDSGYRSGSASSSGTAVKGARANDRANATVVSTGSDQGSTSRPEAAPAAAERRSDAPAPITETVRRNHAIYGGTNRLLISLPFPLILLVPQGSVGDDCFFGYCPVSSDFVF